MIIAACGCQIRGETKRKYRNEKSDNRNSSCGFFVLEAPMSITRTYIAEFIQEESQAAKVSACETTDESSGSQNGNLISISGFVQSLRNLGKIAFLTVRDASGQIQCVVDKPELLETSQSLLPETPVVVQGKLVENPGKKGPREILVSTIEALSSIEATLPVELSKNQKIDKLAISTLLDYRPLTLRNEKVKSIFKIEAVIQRAFREYLSGQNFTEINTPKIVATGTEGGAQLFELEYFGKKAYLAQSPQFYKQIMVGVFERVFETAAVYRAEEHDTTRHLNEYISLDFEMGFIESEQDVIRMQMGLMKHIFKKVKEECQYELGLWGASIPEFEKIPQIGLEEAVTLLQKEYGWTPAQKDLDPAGERLLCEHFQKTEGVDLVYVLHYPLAARPFYTMPLKESSAQGPEGKGAPELKSRGFDLLFRGLEITTGGQRIHQYEELVKAIKDEGLAPEQFQEYLLCFKHGMPPHGGLAIGLERLTKQLLGLKSVKEAALFPRDLNRLRP